MVRSSLRLEKKNFSEMEFSIKQKIGPNLSRIAPHAVDADSGLTEKVV